LYLQHLYTTTTPVTTTAVVSSSKRISFEMVKSYLRYEPDASFGVVASIDSNISYDSSGKHLLSPALEKVGVWNVRQGVCAKNLALLSTSSGGGPSLAVTSIASTTTSQVT
ncbi:hypothetical protein MKX01_003626, partial [Papaver californicum]